MSDRDLVGKDLDSAFCGQGERAGFTVIDRAGEVDYHGWGVLLGSNGAECGDAPIE